MSSPNKRNVGPETVITDSGVLLHLTVDAFLSGGPSAPHYEAYAADDWGNRFNVRWHIQNSTSANAGCDWDHPYCILAI